jgi:hypothetical protein
MPDLIALTDLQDVANLNRNVEERRVKSGIEDAHLELEKVLGRTGYALVYANAPTFSAQAPNAALYVTLLTDYIKPFMCWRSVQRAYVDMSAEADKAGVYKKTGDDYRSVDDKELARLVGQARDRAEARLERLLTFVRDNDAVFTWMDTIQDSEERITRQNTGGFISRRSPRQTPYRG